MNGECEAIEEDEWNAVGLMIGKLRTFTSVIVGKIASVGLRERDGDGDA